MSLSVSKTRNLNLEEVAQFLKSVKSHDTCIYVASGPNAHHCNDFPGSDLIGVNNAWRLMHRKPAVMLTQFARYLNAMDPGFVRWVLCPMRVGVKAKDHHVMDPTQCEFPIEQIRTFEIREEKSIHAETIAQKMNRGEMPFMLRFGGIGTYGLILCALAGYRQIICCGHDGGIGRHPLLHDSEKPKTKHHDENLKRTRELADALVRHRYCSKIVFAQDL